MRVLLIRHCDKLNAETADRDRGLSERGLAQAIALEEKLRRRGVSPDHYFTSSSAHALETAKHLRQQCGRHAGLAQLDSLTPGKDASRPVDVVDSLLDEAGSFDAEVVALIGHEPRLSQLLARMTGRRLHPL